MRPERRSWSPADGDSEAECLLFAQLTETVEGSAVAHSLAAERHASFSECYATTSDGDSSEAR